VTWEEALSRSLRSGKKERGKKRAGKGGERDGGAAGKKESEAKAAKRGNLGDNTTWRYSGGRGGEEVGVHAGERDNTTEEKRKKMPAEDFGPQRSQGETEIAHHVIEKKGKKDYGNKRASFA